MNLDVIPLGDLPKGRLSPSAKTTYSVCGEKYRRQYINMERQAPAVPLMRGSVVHMGFSWAASEQIRGMRRPAEKVIVEYADQATGLEVARSESESNQKTEWKNGENLITLRADVRRAVGAYEAQIGKTLRPVESERLFSHRFDGRPYEISGKLDLYDQMGFVRDIKTVGRRMDENAALHSDALTIYQKHVELTGRVVNGLALDGIVLKKDSIEIQPLEIAPRTEAQKAECMDEFDKVVQGIRAGIFVKANDWDNYKACKTCGFLRDCKPEWYAAKKTAVSDGQ